jgi:hypothetical protein
MPERRRPPKRLPNSFTLVDCTGPDARTSTSRCNPVHHASFGADQVSAQLARILPELDIAKASDWRSCGGEPQAFVRRTLDRFVGKHGGSEIDGAFDLSITLSIDPHECCEMEDEPDGSQMFLYMEAASCGFVNLGPALALCETEHARLPVTFARLFLIVSARASGSMTIGTPKSMFQFSKIITTRQTMRKRSRRCRSAMRFCRPR